DLIVTDLAGRFGFEAGLIEKLGDARRRFLKPGGRLIPSDVALAVAPVGVAEARRRVGFWSDSICGLKGSAPSKIAHSTGYPQKLDRENLLADGAMLTTVDLRQDVRTMSGTAGFVVGRAGTLDGIGGWFRATLAPRIELTNAPGAANRIERRNVFFPLG